eukprot:TRINITY_DN5286_c0_g1_i1.p1 TRINITY_DN5286_c0_g1~~TRINITY_DN5286_c0_g1_i1.p1  ORF type:complete len:267 (-),score=65.86 TRINITY_DN5286_c0_g1_i1:187-921(-)
MSQPAEKTASSVAAQPEQPGEALAMPGTVGPSLTHQLFRGHDPFAEFSADPFSSGGSHRIFGGGFGRVMQRLENLSEEILGVRPVLPPQEPGAARYSVQTASMSAFVGEDGQVHTEQFASSDVGDRDHDIRETHQAYSNSATGEQKRALEQHLGPRGVKTVKKRGGHDAVEESTEMFLGMENTTEARDVFTKDFSSKAQHLPEHQSFRGNFFSGFGAAEAGLQLPGAGSWRRGALEEQGSKGGA